MKERIEQRIIINFTEEEKEAIQTVSEMLGELIELFVATKEIYLEVPQMGKYPIDCVAVKRAYNSLIEATNPY